MPELTSKLDTPYEQFFFETFACCGATVQLLADGHTVRVTPDADFWDEIELWFRVGDSDEEAWGSIVLDVSSGLSTSSVTCGTVCQLDFYEASQGASAPG